VSVCADVQLSALVLPGGALVPTGHLTGVLSACTQ
jgi:hypothetical protein